MSLVRGLLFDNLGLKLVALLLAVVVYLHVYTERPFTALISFTLQLDGIADTLSLSGPVPPAVQAELRGTGKQLIRLRLTEPRLKISLDGVGPGRFHESGNPGNRRGRDARHPVARHLLVPSLGGGRMESRPTQPACHLRRGFTPAPSPNPAPRAPTLEARFFAGGSLPVPHRLRGSGVAVGR